MTPHLAFISLIFNKLIWSDKNSSAILDLGLIITRDVIGKKRDEFVIAGFAYIHHSSPLVSSDSFNLRVTSIPYLVDFIPPLV
jgi:hypothetical protein